MSAISAGGCTLVAELFSPSPQYGLMQHSPSEIKEKLLKALDKEYNVVDMATVVEIISILERTVITKEALETTRLGKYVNELRRKTKDELLAKRAKDLVRRWRVMIQENSSSGSGGVQSQTNGAGSGTVVSPALRSTVSPGLCYRSNLSPALATASSSPYGSSRYVRGATVSPAISLPSSDKSTSPGLSLSSSRLTPMPTSASRSRPTTPHQQQPKTSLMPHSPSLQSNSIVTTDPVPKTHASNKRLRKDAFPSDSTSAPPPKRVARPNGQVMSVMGSRKTFTASPPDFHGECSRDSFGGLSQGSSGCEIVCTMTSTASQNKVPLSEPVKTASQLKQGRKKHSKVDKLSLVNASAVHVPSGDDIVMQKIESKVRTPKVKTTQELVASVQAKTGSIGAREGGTELATSMPENKPSLSNSMFSCRGTATDALEISRNKTEHIAKFLQSQSELEPVPDVLSLPVHSEPAISTGGNSHDGFDGPSTISSQSAGPPVACGTEDRTIEDILAKLPPVDPDSINWDDSVDNSEESIDSPKVVTEEDIERLRTTHTEGVNGNWNDGVKLPDEDDNFREWHQTLSKVSYQGELLHILPYVIID